MLVTYQNVTALQFPKALDSQAQSTIVKVGTVELVLVKMLLLMPALGFAYVHPFSWLIYHDHGIAVKAWTSLQSVSCKGV